MFYYKKAGRLMSAFQSSFHSSLGTDLLVQPWSAVHWGIMTTRGFMLQLTAIAAAAWGGGGKDKVSDEM